MRRRVQSGNPDAAMTPRVFPEQTIKQPRGWNKLREHCQGV